jgi:hypothetical protein
MLASEIREMTLEQLQSDCNKLMLEMVRRVEEEQESRAEVHKAYDQLAEVSDVYETQAKVLRESCEKAAGKLEALVGLPSMQSEAMKYDAEVIKDICNGLFAAIERANRLGDMEE